LVIIGHFNRPRYLLTYLLTIVDKAAKDTVSADKKNDEVEADESTE